MQKKCILKSPAPILTMHIIWLEKGHCTMCYCMIIYNILCTYQLYMYIYYICNFICQKGTHTGTLYIAFHLAFNLFSGKNIALISKHCKQQHVKLSMYLRKFQENYYCSITVNHRHKFMRLKDNHMMWCKKLMILSLPTCIKCNLYLCACDC